MRGSRLRAKAARVQAAIDRMNARVEGLVEDYNEAREALARTRTEQAEARKRVLDAAAWKLLGRRPGVLRLRHRQPRLHPPRRHVRRRRCHDRARTPGRVHVAPIGRHDYIGAVRPTG